MQVAVSHDSFKLAQVFTIARGSRTQADVITVSITRNGVVGRGECVPYARYGETMDSVGGQINSLPDMFDRDSLLTLLPAGAARNAVDCALWDLEAKEAGKPAWALAGLDAPQPMITAYTLSLDTPDAMQAQAREHSFRPLLKTKLGGGDEDVARIRAVRTGAPDATIIVDANEGWTPELYATLAPVLVELGVAMVEQPLPADSDDALLGMERPLPVCADESCAWLVHRWRWHRRCWLHKGRALLILTARYCWAKTGRHHFSLMHKACIPLTANFGDKYGTHCLCKRRVCRRKRSQDFDFRSRFSNGRWCVRGDHRIGRQVDRF